MEITNVTSKKKTTHKVEPVEKSEKNKKESPKKLVALQQIILPVKKKTPTKEVFKNPKTHKSGQNGVGTRTYG